MTSQTALREVMGQRELDETLMQGEEIAVVFSFFLFFISCFSSMKR